MNLSKMYITEFFLVLSKSKMSNLNELPLDLVDRILSFLTPIECLKFSEAYNYPNFTTSFRKCPICIISCWFQKSGKFCDDEKGLNLKLLYTDDPSNTKRVKFEGEYHNIQLFEFSGNTKAEEIRKYYLLKDFDTDLTYCSHEKLSDSDHFEMHAKTGFLSPEMKEFIISKRAEILQKSFETKHQIDVTTPLGWNDIHDFRQQAEFEVFQEISEPFRMAYEKILSLKNKPENNFFPKSNFPNLPVIARNNYESFISSETFQTFYALARFQSLIPTLKIESFARSFTSGLLFRRMIKLATGPKFFPSYFGHSLPWSKHLPKNRPFPSPRIALCLSHPEKCKDTDFIRAYKKREIN